MESVPAAVICNDVSFRIGSKEILQHISLTIQPKTIAGILGQNGAGKTTLLSLLIGLRTFQSGTITVLGQQLPEHIIALRKRIGVVLQETALYEELTIAENLQFAASLYQVPDAAKKIAEMLALLGLSQRAKQRVNTLSGGLRRRTTIARALLHNPELLIIDEPTLGVDAETRHAIWEHLKVLKSTGTTIMVATNYMDEAQALCDTVSILRDGKILISETPEALIAKVGYILDIECVPESTDAIIQAVTGTNGVLRVESTKTGISVFFKGTSVPDAIMRTVLQAAPVHGFRSRPADLAEIFQSVAASL